MPYGSFVSDHITLWTSRNNLMLQEESAVELLHHGHVRPHAFARLSSSLQRDHNGILIEWVASHRPSPCTGHPATLRST